MIRPFARLLAAPAALVAACAVPPAAQAQTFTLPQPTPTPTPTPAGPADERAGVAIPPRAQPTVAPEPRPTATPTPAPSSAASPRPVPTPLLQPSPAPAATPRPVPRVIATPANDPQAAPNPEPAAPPETAETENPADAQAPLVPAGPAPLNNAPAATSGAADEATAETVAPDWWPWAAGGLGALALMGGAAMLRRRRKPKPLRLAAPVAATAAAPPSTDLPRLDLTLDITGATRSVMMFTLQYRLTIANRSERAVNDLNVAVQLACARASAAAAPGAGNAPSPGTAQAVDTIARVGPHQARTVTGQVQLPLSAIQPLRQGQTPLFVPLVHITLEGEGQRAMNRSFVIGTPSASGTGRLHPILLDQPPGGVAGLVAQAIASPPVSAAA